MQLVTYRSLWGMTGRLEEQLMRVREGGFDGVEWLPPSESDEPIFRAVMRDLDLRFIACVSTPGPLGGPDPVTATPDTDHVAEYERAVGRAMTFEPDKITTNVGLDTMSDSEAFGFFDAALKIDETLGIPVGHETHRRRILYTPWRTGELLRRFPSLRICADFSHWVVTAARLLEDLPTDMDLAIERTVHTQGRVGYPHGPQVSDPRAPEHAKYQAKFESWWAEIIRARLVAGDAEFTFQPEYGPAEYLHLQPYTMQPVADLWDINIWARDRFIGFYRAVVDRLESAGATESG